MLKLRQIVPPSVGLYTTAEVESRTGIPSTTLRQWERRYGLPNPQRKSNGYRLYSEADLQHLQFIQVRLSEGIVISRAVELCLEHFKTAPVALPPLEPSQQMSERRESSLERGLMDYVEELLQATLKADFEWAAQILSNGYARFTLEDVLTHIIEPVLREVGKMWQRGEITIAHEHQASAYLRGKLQILLDMVGQPQLGPGVVVACGPGETHEIGSLMLSVMLRRAGVRVFYLGADTPLETWHCTQKATRCARCCSVWGPTWRWATSAASFPNSTHSRFRFFTEERFSTLTPTWRMNWAVAT